MYFSLSVLIYFWYFPHNLQAPLLHTIAKTSLGILTFVLKDLKQGTSSFREASFYKNNQFLLIHLFTPLVSTHNISPYSLIFLKGLPIVLKT